MKKAVNDASLVKAGDIYQYYIALRDCFSMKKGDKLQIEKNGDVSVISQKSKNSFQKEVKHHFNEKKLISRDIDFWKTLSNWYKEYDRIRVFSDLILYTTAIIDIKSLFNGWNNKKPKEKLSILNEIGSKKKDNEEGFRKYYNNIFSKAVYNEQKLLDILSRFTIECSKKQISGISSEFSCYVGHIPEINRDNYIAALLGQILAIIKEPPHQWEVTREEFDKILQLTSPSFSNPKEIPLPNDFADMKVPIDGCKRLEHKNFVNAIRNIKYDSQIPDAISDYWKAEMTVLRYFKDDFLYLESLPLYKGELKSQLKYVKENKKIEVEGSDINNQIKNSKLMYNQIMAWDAKDFGSIIRNQGYFQRGIIHTIVDENEFNWDLGEVNEH